MKTAEKLTLAILMPVMYKVKNNLTSGIQIRASVTYCEPFVNLRRTIPVAGRGRYDPHVVNLGVPIHQPMEPHGSGIPLRGISSPSTAKAVSLHDIRLSLCLCVTTPVRFFSMSRAFSPVTLCRCSLCSSSYLGGDVSLSFYVVLPSPSNYTGWPLCLIPP